MDWCWQCCTRHEPAECPTEIRITGPERRAWRGEYETPRGSERFGVLVAPAGESWCARLFTHPNILWTIPGGRGSMRFLGPTESDAERQAIAFVEQHCRQQKYRRLDDLGSTDGTQVQGGNGPGVGSASERRQPRKPLQVPTRWGLDTPSQDGQTGNVSTDGLFILTSSPAEPGSTVRLRVELEACHMPLKGRVMWARPDGNPPGMGVRLIRPPGMYVGYVERLA